MALGTKGGGNLSRITSHSLSRWKTKPKETHSQNVIQQCHGHVADFLSRTTTTTGGGEGGGRGRQERLSLLHICLAGLLLLHYAGFPTSFHDGQQKTHKMLHNTKIHEEGECGHLLRKEFPTPPKKRSARRH